MSKPIISFVQKGGFSNTERLFNNALAHLHLGTFDQYGRAGVEALRGATPVDTGLTANSWKYRIVSNSKSTRIFWYNTNEVDGVNIAVILQYGHGLRQGGYVKGIDYINPAMRPLFQNFADEAWDLIVDKRKK